MKELKIKIWNKKNVVFMKVLEQDESVRHKLIIYEGKNGIDIESDDFPDLYRYRICIWGSDKEFDDRIASFEFDTEKEAREYMDRVKDTVAEYNESLKQILDKEEKDSFRKCSECQKRMNEGYILFDGEEYYCSDECLHKHYSEEEYQEIYDGDNGFYTVWED